MLKKTFVNSGRSQFDPSLSRRSLGAFSKAIARVPDSAWSCIQAAAACPRQTQYPCATGVILV